MKNPQRLTSVKSVAIVGVDCEVASVGSGIADGLSSQLLLSQYNIVERAHFSKILDEQRLTLTDFLTERESIVGKIKGVDAIIVGTASLSSGWAGMAFGGYKTYISTATARMIDVETGEVLLAVTYSNSNPSTNATPIDIGRKLAKKITSSK